MGSPNFMRVSREGLTDFDHVLMREFREGLVDMHQNHSFFGLTDYLS